MVADYLLRGLLAFLAIVGVAPEVRAQSPIRVGYYDMTSGNGAGVPEQVPPILLAGFVPVPLETLTAADLAGLHVLMVQNPSPNVYGTEYLASRAAISAAVSSGMVLIIHDRVVANLQTNSRVGDILPGVASAASIMASKATSVTVWNNIEITDLNSLVVAGPFGPLTAASLDNGNQSLHGVVNIPFSPLLPQPRRGLLHTVNGPQTGLSQAVTFSYQFGAGQVIYSSIPLDNFLKGGGNNPPRDTFTNVYAPNLLTYAVCGLKAFPATVSVASATGHYGGTTTLTATVKCGVIPVSGATVTFTLNGVTVGSEPTNAEGVATKANVSFGSSPASAIAVGSYPTGVTASFAGTTQYGASSGTAPLTVGKAPATLSFAGGTFVYDATPHAATGTVTGVFHESLGVPSFTYTDEHGATFDTAPVNAGVYRITASVGESANYLGTSADTGATITITRAPLAVAAQDKTKLYGAALPPLTVTYAGFVGGQDPSVLGGTLQLTTEATAASHAGDYRITPSGLTSNNYEMSFVDGVLTVTPAPLTVRADDASKPYGAPLPAFTARFEGFVLGDTPALLGGSLAFATTATVASHVGRYPITPSGLTSPDYSITFSDGHLTIRPAPLKIRADNKERLERLPNPALTLTYEGFVLGDDERNLDSPPQVSTSAQQSSPDGEYPIVVKGAQDADYAIEHVDGVLTVSPEGRMHGNGVVDAVDAKHHVDFAVSDTIRVGEKGWLKLEIERKRGSGDRFVSLLVSDVIFEDVASVNPGGKAEADSVTIVGVGRWNSLPATFEASATDNGEPGRGADVITIRVFVAGKLVNTTSGALKSGNIQSNRLPRRK
jgi:hypothetical protein